jgi:hypothetical protein
VTATRSLVEINSVSKEHDASIFRKLIIQGKLYGEKQRKRVREGQEVYRGENGKMKDTDNVKKGGRDDAKLLQGITSTNTNILLSSFRRSRGSSVSVVKLKS